MAAARDEARLLLPSPLGLLEYDLLEGATAGQADRLELLALLDIALPLLTPDERAE